MALGSTLKVQAFAGAHATILETDDHFPGRTILIEADWTNAAWTIEKLHYSAIGAEGLTIALSNTKFEVIAGHKTRIASGTAHPDGWEFKDPAWLKGKTVR